MHCHGYLLLDGALEAEFEPLLYRDLSFTVPGKGHIRAIAKELLPTDAGHFTFDLIPRMRQNMEDINRLGICVWNVREGNYLGGRLVDFSQALVVPHIDLD